MAVWRKGKSKKSKKSLFHLHCFCEIEILKYGKAVITKILFRYLCICSSFTGTFGQDEKGEDTQKMNAPIHNRKGKDRKYLKNYFSSAQWLIQGISGALKRGSYFRISMTKLSVSRTNTV